MRYAVLREILEYSRCGLRVIHLIHYLVDSAGNFRAADPVRAPIRNLHQVTNGSRIQLQRQRLLHRRCLLINVGGSNPWHEGSIRVQMI
jgi:hypothetical protein